MEYSHFIFTKSGTIPDEGQSLSSFIPGNSRVFISSDFHFGHRFIAGLRGYKPEDEPERADNRYRGFGGAIRMNDDIVNAVNSVVNADDVLVNLGDVTSGSLSWIREMDRVNGFKILVAGNHDGIWSRVNGSISEKTLRAYMDHFDVIVSKGSIFLNDDRNVLLSHLPSVGDSHDYESRYDMLRVPSSTGPESVPVICGHVHEAWRVNGRNLNVGVDFGMEPCALEDAVNEASMLTGVGAERTDLSISELGRD